MEDNFPKAYKEVIEILKHFPKRDINKIPQKWIDLLNRKMDKSYEFQVDINKSLEEQDLLEETKDILANLYRDYFADEKEKANIREKEKQEIEQIEKEKREKYPVDVFKERKYIPNIETTEVIVKKQSRLIRIKNFIKKILHID